MVFKDAMDRLRKRSSRSSQLPPAPDGTNLDAVQPPPGPPPAVAHERNQDHSFPGAWIRPVELPLVLPAHRYNLAAQGWTTVTLSGSPQGEQLRQATQSLFAAGKTFFDRDEEYKKGFVTKMGSEEGWNCIPGEKEFITIRSLEKVPSELVEAAATYWELAGSLLTEMLGGVAKSLELEPEALKRYSKPCSQLGGRTATMLRLFRYEGWEDKVVAEPHNDLGLLSLVMGNTPGLEVWNGLSQSFLPIEKTYPDLSATATVLVGRQLQRLTSGRYTPGGHLVRSYSRRIDQVPDGRQDRAPEKRYRFSIVFVLRGHYPLAIDAESLTSTVTGVPSMITDGMTMKELFVKIKHAHYNINTGIQDREEQKRKIREKGSVDPASSFRPCEPPEQPGIA